MRFGSRIVEEILVQGVVRGYWQILMEMESTPVKCASTTQVEGLGQVGKTSDKWLLLVIMRV